MELKFEVGRELFYDEMMLLYDYDDGGGGGDDDHTTSSYSIARSLSSSSTSSYVYNCIDYSQEHVSTCPTNCTGLEACLACECEVESTVANGGPWGDVMDFFLLLLPIIYLVVVTVKPNPTPTTVSLPMSALIMFLVRTMYLGSNPLLCSACAILGVHEALTPLSVMGGAIFLFETMEQTKCLPFMMREMKALTKGHKVAEAMLIYGFATIVEGASGFGTPVALGAPMLVSTGHPPLESLVLMLVFNTFVTVWGAVGTPLWFGFAPLQLSDDDLLAISYRSSIAMIVSAIILLPWILTVLIPFSFIRKNLVFLYLSTFSVMGPLVGLSFFSYEFPSLLAGLVGCAVTAFLIKFRVGLAEQTPDDAVVVDAVQAGAEDAEKGFVDDIATTDLGGDTTERFNDDDDDDMPGTEIADNDNTLGSISKVTGSWNDDIQKDNADAPATIVNVSSTTTNQVEVKASPPKQPHTSSLFQSSIRADELLGPRKSFAEGYIKEVIMRTFPIWGVVLTLILTRVPAFKIKGKLTSQTPYWGVQFGTYGDFRISASVVLQLKNILTYPNLNWKYEVFYVPFLIPFVLISLLTMLMYRKDMTCRPRDIAGTVATRLTNPAIAVMGALVLVQLMLKGGKESPAHLLGSILAGWLKGGFVAISPLVGALGSFFSGSTTVSNLTFGEIQRIAATEIGISVNSMLALQAVGASAGNGICLNNIIAGLTVVGLNVSEGQILKRTAKYVFSLTTIAMIVMLAVFIRF